MGLPALLPVVVGGLAIAAALVARRSGRTAAIALGVGLGAMVLGLRVLALPPGGPAPRLATDARGPWTATVDSMGTPRDGAQVARLRLLVDGREVVVAATLPAFPEIAAGAVVRVDGSLRLAQPDDPYGAYLLGSGASGSLQARQLDIVRAPPSATVQSVRDGAGDALRLALPEPEAGLAAGILIGLRERVDRQLAADFATAGVSHVVAISGWNIAIVAALVAAIMRGRPRRLVAIVVGGTIVAYVVAAGASPSVVRAAVMASVVLLARESGRAGRATAALAVAVSILLLVDPAMIGDAGFRLSVLATAGLLAWATPLGAWLGRLWGGRLPSWLAESLGITLAAQAATLPDVLVTFGRLSLVSPVVNLLVVPLVPASMAAGLLALLAGGAAMLGSPPMLATLAGLPGWLLLHVMVWVVRTGASVPFAAVAIPPELTLPVGGLAALLLVGAIAAIRHRQRHPRRARPTPTRPKPAKVVAGRGGRPARRRLGSIERALVAAAALVIAIAGIAIAQTATLDTRVTILDVGQGDAILVESRTGARMLVDGGPDPDRLLLQLDARIPPWDRRIDVIVLTHPHEDHVAGLARVLQRYRVGQVYEPGMNGPGPGWKAWDAALRDGDPPRGTLSTGAHLQLGEVSFTVLWPDPGAVPRQPAATGKGINDVSIVLLGEANGRRFLLTGDMEEEVDPVLVKRGLPRVDLLKVAHHGSATASTAPFLAAVRPTIAVISVGAGNDYGHPAPATVDRLRATGAKVFRTDLDGVVTVDVHREGLSVETSGGRSAAIATGGTASGYDPSHDHPLAPGGRSPACLARAAPVVRRARVRRGGYGRVARTSRGGERAPGRSVARRDGRAAARRRQAARGRRAGPPRRGLRRLARGARDGRARAGRARPPGHAPGG